MFRICDIHHLSIKVAHEVNGDCAFSLSFEGVGSTSARLCIQCILDGVSSENPEFSSRLAAKSIRKTIAGFTGELEEVGTLAEEERMFFFYHVMRTAILSADMELFMQDEPCGTTVSMAILYGDTVYSANVGDSPMYLVDMKEERVTELYSCHNRAGIAATLGEITKEEALTSPDKRYLVRLAGGLQKLHESDVYTQKTTLPEDGLLLLGSDGALAVFPEEELLIISKETERMKDFCDAVRTRVENLGGRDDFTLLATKVIKE